MGNVLNQNKVPREGEALIFKPVALKLQVAKTKGTLIH